MKQTAALLCTAFFVLVATCTGALCAEPLPITVGIPPMQYFAQGVGGDLVDVTVMVPPGSDPHTYEPKPRAMAALARTRLYIACGAPFEAAWLPRFRSANPAMLVADASHGVPKQPMAQDDDEDEHEDEHGRQEQHHEEDHHDHEGLDPHIWLSPKRALIMAAHIRDALIQAAPQHTQAFTANHEALAQSIQQLDRDITALLAAPGTKHGRSFMVFHPSWGYFATDYDLTQIPVEHEGKSPSARELAALITKAKHLGIRTVFVQPQFPRSAAQTIAHEIGGTTVIADPLAAHWNQNLLGVATAISKALR